MSKRISLMAATLLIFSAVSFVAAQTTTTTVTQTPTTVTKTVQHPDGTYTVIEYPVGKEVQLNLNPVTITKGKGIATILRDDNGTKVILNLTDVPADVTAVNLYAVDETGAVSSLGPVAVSNGMGTLTATTPLNKFMLIAAPDAALTTYDPNTKIFFRSAVPEGFAVIPHTTVPIGEKVSATAAETSPVYKVPMLNIPAYEKGDDTKVKVNFTGELAGSRANVFITPKKGDATKVKLRFHELKDAPAGKVYTLWAVGADNTFARLGQIVNTGNKNEAEIESSVTLPDFGLLVTTEDATAVTTLVRPVGPAIGIFEIVR
jgi:hypothetical protein